MKTTAETVVSDFLGEAETITNSQASHLAGLILRDFGLAVSNV